MSYLTFRLNNLRKAVYACKLCPGLGPCVASVGPSTPSLFVIGQSPGEREADCGVPFTGPAGQLLDNLLESAGVARAATYITNAAKCTPPGNRRLAPEELDNCRHHLVAELKLLKPRAILCLGRDAYRLFSQTLPWVHGALITYPYMRERFLLSYHPAYFLRGGTPDVFLELAPKLKELVYG
jgi:uracil-DNA glycosylase